MQHASRILSTFSTLKLALYKLNVYNDTLVAVNSSLDECGDSDLLDNFSALIGSDTFCILIFPECRLKGLSTLC
jgi:hypothetical protein